MRYKLPIIKFQDAKQRNIKKLIEEEAESTSLYKEGDLITITYYKGEVYLKNIYGNTTGVNIGIIRFFLAIEFLLIYFLEII